MNGWYREISRCELSLTELCLEQARAQIQILDVTIDDARRTLARALETDHQTREITRAIAAVKSNVERKERSTRQERYTCDAEFNHSRLNKRLGFPQKTIAGIKPSDKKFDKKSFRPRGPSKQDRP